MKKLLLLFVLSLPLMMRAQDTIITKQGDKIVGDLKSFENGVLKISTAYSYDDFTVKWNQVALLHTKKKFKLYNKAGDLLIGPIQLDTTDNSLRVHTNDSTTVMVRKDNIGELYSFGNTFKDQFDFEVNIGFNATQENKTVNLTLDIETSYEGKNWEITADYSGYANYVDSILTNRNNFLLEGIYYLPKNWFTAGIYNYFTSSALQLNYRNTYNAGFGRILIRRNYMNLVALLGFTANNEKYYGDVEERHSEELLSSLSYGWYPNKDTEFKTNITFYPSLTTKDRYRGNLSINGKIKVRSHITLGASYTLNLDTKPPLAGSNTSDYIVNVSLGWEL